MPLIPHENDVLLGRGRLISAHPGNVRFRSLVAKHKKEYAESSDKNTKRRLASLVVEEIESLSPSGRFLIETTGRKLVTTSEGAWVSVGKEKAIEKAMHRLREQSGKNNYDVQQQATKQSNISSNINPHFNEWSNFAGGIENIDNSERSGQADSNFLFAANLHNQLIQGQVPMSDSSPPIGQLLGSPVASCDVSSPTVPSISQPTLIPISHINKFSMKEIPQNTGKLVGSPMSSIMTSNHGGVSQRRNPPGSKSQQPVAGQLGGSQASLLPNESGGSYQTNDLPISPSPQLHIKNDGTIIEGYFERPNNTVNNLLGTTSGLSMQKNESPLVGKTLDISEPEIKNYDNSALGRNDYNQHYPLQTEEAPFPAGGVVNEQGVLCDDEFDAFISLHFNNETNNSDPFENVSLRKWIGLRKPSGNGIYSSYIQESLVVALKLTQCLIRAKKDAESKGCRNSIPLYSIVATNTIVTIAKDEMSRSDLWQDLSEENIAPQTSESEKPKDIQEVNIVCQAGDNTEEGSGTSRLVALGVIFYELFSCGDPSSDQITTTFGPRSTRSLSNIRLSDGGSIGDDSSSSGPNSKRRSPFSEDDPTSQSAARLERLGVPQSLCALVFNLLDCKQGEFCGDEAYKSFDDVCEDLQLMIDEPSRYLDDAKSSNQSSQTETLYGREENVAKLQDAYKHCLEGKCCGALVTGGGGVGKSVLVQATVQQLTNESKGYFISGKFEQNNTSPFSVVGGLFNSLCDLFAEDIRTHQQEHRVASALQAARGTEAGFLSDILPSLSKLMPLYATYGSSSVDPVSRTRYLFNMLLQTLSSHSKPITIFIDDLQWSDPFSAMLIEGLLQNAKNNKSVFFMFCCRAGENQLGPSGGTWMRSLDEFALEKIHLKNLSVDDVNRLVSGTLHLLPRLTRPLSSILYCKTLGNPFFVWQTLGMLQKEGYIYFSLRGVTKRWMWDLEKISDLHIDENVITLLMREMEKLPNDLLSGLKAVACIGTGVDRPMVDILSKPLGASLFSSLRKAMQKGYIIEVGSQYRFAHDRVAEAAYELMSQNEKCQDHMKFGLALCSHSLDNSSCDKLVFLGVNQINRGGPRVLSDQRQKDTIAKLNLKVGQKSKELTDFTSALSYFKSGIDFLNSDHWVHQYQLSIDLFTSAAQAACDLDDTPSVKLFTEPVFAHAKNYDDKLPALYVAALALKKERAVHNARKYILNVLEELGEDASSVLDAPPTNNPQMMKDLIGGMDDDFILNMAQSTDKIYIFIMKFYFELIYLYQVIDPTCISALSFRMVQLTFSVGATDVSPVALAHFAVAITTSGDPSLGYRLGCLSRRFAEKLNATGYIPVIITIQMFISWVAEPFHSLAETLLLGFNLGMKCGDNFGSSLNYFQHASTSFFCGRELNELRKIIGDYTFELLQMKKKWFVHLASMLYWQTVELIEGLDFKPADDYRLIPTEQNIREFALKSNQKMLSLAADIHQVMRAFFFRHEMSTTPDVLSLIFATTFQLRPFILNGIFYEGLLAFSVAKQTRDSKKWSVKGEKALTFLKKWESSSKWNFENKVKLLAAEKESLSGSVERAAQLYHEAIKSSQQHRFPHEEAISWELQGLFYYNANLFPESLASLNESVGCYKKWGARAVAARVECFITNHFAC